LPRAFLFVAPQRGAFGEAALGARLARALVEEGDRATFWAPSALGVLVEGSGVRHVAPPAHDPTRLDDAILEAAKAERPDAVVLLDVASVYSILKGSRRDRGFAGRFDVPLVGLDVWNLAETGRLWGLPDVDVARRLIPVPFARPSGQPGLYNALPAAPAITEGERLLIREDLGIDGDQRMLLLTSAEWQNPKYQPDVDRQRLAALFPRLLAFTFERLDARVKIVHVGPDPYPVSDRLGGRYTWLAQRSPLRFKKLLAAADLYMTFNFSGTTVHEAIASGVPTLLGVNSRAGSPKSVLAELGSASDDLRSWLTRVGTLRRFLVFPLGLHDHLAPLVQNNPYTSALRTVEVLDEGPFRDACHALLFDTGAREEARARQAAYREQLSKLPTGTEVLRGHIHA
jgi:hypothetical protein